jgi:hypothetical protein
MHLFWKNSGYPDSKFKLDTTEGYCATCGTVLTMGVASEILAGDAFSRQSEFLAHGTHVCAACAWMYSTPKETHRNVLAVDDKIWWPMIGHDSATAERPTWYKVLSDVAMLPPGTPCIGVLTTDPKPRLWPMTQQRTLGDFGLYVHCPDYDISEFRTFDLKECLATCELIIQCLALGFSKQACWHGLLNDLKKVNKLGMQKVVGLEERLCEVRHTEHFLPSLLVSGIKKEMNKPESVENLNTSDLVLKPIYSIPIQEVKTQKPKSVSNQTSLF